MDATRRRRTRDPVRKRWYAIWRRWRFARHLGFVEFRSGTALAVTSPLRITITQYEEFERVLKFEDRRPTEIAEERHVASEVLAHIAKPSRCRAASDERVPAGHRVSSWSRL